MKGNCKFSLIPETVDEMYIGNASVAYNYLKYGSLLNYATNIRKISIFNNFERPKYQTFTPFPYQWDSVDMMLNKFEGRGVFADQVGLGKTVQALLAAHVMFLAGEIFNCVIVASSNLLPQWKKEVETKFAGVFRFVDSEKGDMNFGQLKSALNRGEGEFGFEQPTIFFISLEALKRNVEQENTVSDKIREVEKALRSVNDNIRRETENDSGKSDEQKDYEHIATYMNTHTKSMRQLSSNLKKYLDKKEKLEEEVEKLKATSILFQKIDLLIVDEAHAPAKNPEQSKLLQKLNKTYCILISATPIRENIDDIYNLIKIVDGNRFPTIDSFYNFCGARSISELVSEDGDFEKISRLNGLINSLFTRKRLYDSLVVKSFELKSKEVSEFLLALAKPSVAAADELLKIQRFSHLKRNEVVQRVDQIKKFIDISAGIIMRKGEIPERPDLLAMFVSSKNHDINDTVNTITQKYISRGLMEYYKTSRDILVLDYLDWTRPPKVGECLLVKDKEAAFTKLSSILSPQNRDNKTKILIFAKSVSDRQRINELINKIDPSRKVFLDNTSKGTKQQKSQNMSDFKEYQEEIYDSIYLIDKTRKEGSDFNIASRLVLFQMESPNSTSLIEPLEMEQLIGRISRVGQKESCRIYLFTYNHNEQELFNIYNDPEGLDLFGKCSTEIDFVVPIIVEYFNKIYSHDQEFIKLRKKGKSSSFVELFDFAYNYGGEIYENFKQQIRRICQQFITDLKQNEEQK